MRSEENPLRLVHDSRMILCGRDLMYVNHFTWMFKGMSDTWIMDSYVIQDGCMSSSLLSSPSHLSSPLFSNIINANFDCNRLYM